MSGGATGVPGGVPAVSVVIPTYNRRRQVERAAASVLAQTFQDFELLVIDDGSHDGTGQSLGGLDERVRYRWQANRGPAAARNAGIHLARGPVVAFLDADNRWLPEHLEVVAAVLARHPETVLASTCPGFRASGSQPPQDARLIDALPLALMGNSFGYVSCIAVRRDVLLAIGGFDEELAVGEDDDLWLRLAMKGPFAMVQRRTVIRRHTRGGLRDRGRAAGLYTQASRRSLTRAIGQLERELDPERDELLTPARARLHVLAVGGRARASRPERRGYGADAGLCAAAGARVEPRGDPDRSCGRAPTIAPSFGGALRQPQRPCRIPAGHSALYLRAYAAVLCADERKVVRRPRNSFSAGRISSAGRSSSRPTGPPYGLRRGRARGDPPQHP